MGEHTKILLKLDQLVPATEKNEWETKSTSLLSSNGLSGKIDKASAPTDVWSRQQTIEIHITAPDVAGMVNTRLRGTAVWLHLIAALIVGFNKDAFRSDSRFNQQPYFSKLLTLNIVLCLYALRVWKLGVRMEKKKRPHISVVPLGFLYVFDQVFSYLLIIVCSCVWTGVKDQNCLNNFSQGYCQRAQAGLATSFVGWLFLIAPSVVTSLRLAGKLRDALIVAKATARWHRKLWQ
ncbi:hypothetical protein MPTK1_4g00790 [Marchantia polymorpha subsp. ruderalis]|uniref:CASP-like protein n=2 Tax=Marchantia polymorpha TaxID=3197 RepID=A0A176VKM9_MARPO|nr:hypothetical protein AXG93_948s1120 [Marchantia polymorpha subsp. ruderalis]PTQ36106.1 hypothetical protein MARPO_0066s0063 [Marchantia polymorpha]BBN07078.1 hypothetical protein Mp_4g00790 [Marchantia polymorpha subsp. ruderalis]|eukprot:PTQ36106.1 hypothetical protein MARPO_0066s0063 [Marchantia polymorpha]